jgi:creatinine amidohydrolase
VKIAERSWMQVEELLKREDRVVLPIGSTEQHAYLSLATDSILAERVAIEAAEPLGVPVFPVLSYGFTPNFTAYPGTVTLRIETLTEVVRDVLDGLTGQGFRRILIVNGHGGNAPIHAFTQEYAAAHPGVRVRMHDWWNAPRVWAQVESIDPVASHASWMENFPWTRLAGVAMPDAIKPAPGPDWWKGLTPAEIRARLGDGNFAGRYQRSDDEMAAIWTVAVAETRALLESGWD